MLFAILALFIIISIAFRLASALGLAIPLLYALVAPTLFANWFYSNQPLAEGIGYALFALVAFSWVISIIRKVAGWISYRREDKITEEMFLYRLRQAQSAGVDTNNVEWTMDEAGDWYYN